MNQMPEPIAPLGDPIMIPFVLLLGMSAVVAWIFYRRYTGLSGGQSALLCLLAVILAIGLVVLPISVRWHWGGNSFMRPVYQGLLFAELLSFLTVPFAARLYRKWIDGHLTEAEKLPSIEGVRAWLSVGNVICAVLIPLCIMGAFEPKAQIFQPVTLIPLLFGLLLAYPLINMASHSTQPVPVAPAEDLSKEREKVLQLLEAGKINPIESTELLNALAHSAPTQLPKTTAEINPQRKMVLFGAALLLIGFFLPWFTINTGEEMNRIFSQFQQNMNQQMPNMPMNFPQINSTVLVSGGDIGHGLGWWILLLGIGAAVLPFFATTLEASMQKKIILAALGVGAILLVYVLSDAIRYVSFGILLVLAGYALEIVGTLKERPLAR
jgi:hypothetical protein